MADFARLSDDDSNKDAQAVIARLETHYNWDRIRHRTVPYLFGQRRRVPAAPNIYSRATQVGCACADVFAK